MVRELDADLSGGDQISVLMFVKDKMSDGHVVL